MKPPSKAWTHDERHRLVLAAANRIRDLARRAAYDDETRRQIFNAADTQLHLLTESRHFLESNREQIERDCGI